MLGNGQEVIDTCIKMWGGRDSIGHTNFQNLDGIKHQIDILDKTERGFGYIFVMKPDESGNLSILKVPYFSDINKRKTTISESEWKTSTAGLTDFIFHDGIGFLDFPLGYSMMERLETKTYKINHYKDIQRVIDLNNIYIFEIKLIKVLTQNLKNTEIYIMRYC